MERNLSRGGYAMSGALLLLFKYLIDVLVARVFFERSLDPLDYLAGGAHAPAVGNQQQILVFGAIALPFVVAGTWLTLWRLRSAGLSQWLVLVFFVPFLHYVMFALLCLLPDRPPAPVDMPVEVPPRPASGEQASWRWLLVAILAPLPPAALVFLLAVQVLRSYGAGLFVGVPFAIGFVSVIVRSFSDPMTPGKVCTTASSSVLLALCLLLLGGLEGMGCIAMALPLALPLAIAGGFLAWSVVETCWLSSPRPPRSLGGLVLVLPALVVVEGVADVEPVERAVTTHIDVAAPPERVFAQVVAFAEIEETPEWWFRAGIAYPKRARIEGRGAGAVRYCEFSTGTFVEPIEVWDEPRRLAFRVTACPPPMHELSPWGAITAPHLDGYFVSRRGEFRLEPLPGGGTRLFGTTWYVHDLSPPIYWRLWTDAIIHRIHGRVLRHVKMLAEAS